jgi:hypothetical protein
MILFEVIFFALIIITFAAFSVLAIAITWSTVRDVYNKKF